MLKAMGPTGSLQLSLSDGSQQEAVFIIKPSTRPDRRRTNGKFSTTQVVEAAGADIIVCRETMDRFATL